MYFWIKFSKCLCAFRNFENVSMLRAIIVKIRSQGRSFFTFSGFSACGRWWYRHFKIFNFPDYWQFIQRWEKRTRKYFCVVNNFWIKFSRILWITLCFKWIARFYGWSDDSHLLLEGVWYQHSDSIFCNGLI